MKYPGVRNQVTTGFNFVGAEQRICRTFVIEDETPSTAPVGPNKCQWSSCRVLLDESAYIHSFGSQRFAQRLAKDIAGDFPQERGGHT